MHYFVFIIYCMQHDVWRDANVRVAMIRSLMKDVMMIMCVRSIVLMSVVLLNVEMVQYHYQLVDGTIPYTSTRCRLFLQQQWLKE
jgi:hypothetical protein